MATKKKFAVFAQMALIYVHILIILQNLSANSRITSRKGRLGYSPIKRGIWAHKNLVWPRKKNCRFCVNGSDLYTYTHHIVKSKSKFENN